MTNNNLNHDKIEYDVCIFFYHNSGTRIGVRNFLHMKQRHIKTIRNGHGENTSLHRFRENIQSPQKFTLFP